MARFLASFHPGGHERILDVGGYPAFWAQSGLSVHFTILNIHPIELPAALRHRFTAVVGDGTKLPFKDKAFDIVFSNSVIEHLHNWEAQQQFAQEVKRVGHRYWVQTPAKEFFVEPHLLTPCIHWLPRHFQLRLARCTVWGLIERPSAARAKEYVSELRLLKLVELSRLFPNSVILREKVLGLSKSYMAVRAE